MNTLTLAVGAALANTGIRRGNKIQKLYPGTSPTNRAFIMVSKDLDAPILLGVYCEGPTPGYYSQTAPPVEMDKLIVGDIFNRDEAAPRRS